MNDKNTHVFKTEDELRDFIGKPIDLALAKSINHLDKYCRAFISKSPFLTIGTASSNGQADVSPRGDSAGFVQILDETTLFIPDRPGNNRIDTMSNIINNPEVGLLFLVPGYEDCLRVNGFAEIVKDEALLKAAMVRSRTPKLGIRVNVREAYLHCAKAIKRSRLWDEDNRQNRRELPSIGKMILEQTKKSGEILDKSIVAEVDQLIEEDYKTGLY